VKRVLVLLALAPCLLGAGWDAHWQVRDAVVALQVPQLGTHVSVVGDSIVEAYAGEILCGKRVLNVGYGGITTGQLALDGVAWWQAWQQRGQVLYNSYQTWRQAHADLVQALQRSGAKVVLVTIPPPERGAPVSRDAVMVMNAGVKFLGIMWGLLVVDVYSAVAGPDGYMPPGGTVDGIHPTATTYQAITAVLEEGCQ